MRKEAQITPQCVIMLMNTTMQTTLCSDSLVFHVEHGNTLANKLVFLNTFKNIAAQLKSVAASMKRDMMRHDCSEHTSWPVSR